VGWLGAVQSQDYGGGKWAIAQRIDGMTEATIEQAINDGALVRTHILRPTWHFVAPQDLRWMLDLTAARVKMKMSYYDRTLEMDEAVVARSNDVITKALAGGKHLTRAELGAALQQAGVATNDLRLGFLMGHAELDGVICSGAMRGKQFTYALIDERVPPASALTRDEALAELAHRYFISRGPATLQDYVWWSGLTTAEAKEGIEAVRTEFVEETIEGETTWRSPVTTPAQIESPTIYLLPNYDEYIVGYADRSAIYDEQHGDKLDSRGNVLFNNTIVLDGVIVGTWKRTLKKREVVIEPTLFVPFTPAQIDAFAQAAQRYSDYLGLPVTIKYPEVN
jgi:hypothetical protein